MLNARLEVRTLSEASTLAVSPAPALITEHDRAFGAPIALQALCIRLNISWRWG
jgi:hypothetical protein